MGIRPTCPKCRKPAHRVYTQTSNPETHRSTSVPVPGILCATTEFKNGHGAFRVEKGQHGLVLLDASAFAVQVRQSRALVARIPKGSRKGGRPLAKPKAKAKPKAAPKAKPKAAAPATE
jgi:hypothetical protein